MNKETRFKLNLLQYIVVLVLGQDHNFSENEIRSFKKKHI